MKKIKLVPYIKTISGDLETPITLFQKYVGDSIGFLLESKEQPKGRYSFLAAKPFIIIKAFGTKVHILHKGKEEIKEGRALEIAKAYIEKFEVINTTKLPFIGGAVGTIGYDIIRQYEYLPNQNIDSVGTPDMHLLFVKELLVYDHYYNNINMVVLEEDNTAGSLNASNKLEEITILLKKETVYSDKIVTKTKLNLQSNMSKKTFIEAVNKAKEYIYNGDIFQVVLSRKWSAKCTSSAFDLYRKLRQVNPSPYMFYFNYENYHIVGSSPEMLVELRKDKIYNCPIAGTRKRGETEKEDKLLAEELLQDEKEKSEHIMLVDLGRNDMGKVSRIGSVKVKEYMNVKKYSHVMHIVSLLEGEKKEKKDMFDILMSFLPAGTLSGAPKIRAMEIIDELEISKRGVYGGAIGYFGFDGDMDMCIVIRTMLIKEGIVYLQAGAGIVADSDAEKEYEETQSKVQGLIEAIK